jgi:hypothetical protein
MVKMTFTLDAETAEVLRMTTARLAKTQSAIVREAIREYGSRAGRLSEDERRRMLRSIDAFVTGRPGRSAAAVDREMREVREARRRGGRRSG